MRIVLMATALVALFCSVAQAAPAIDSEEASHVAHHSTTSPVTWTFNNVAGTTLFVAVDATRQTGTAPTFGAVSYNGVAMTAVPSSLVSWDVSKLQWYYLNSPATGSHTVSVATSGATDTIAAAISFTGLDSTTPYGTPVTHPQTTGASSDSVNVTGTTSGNFVLSAIGTGSGGEAATSPNTLSAKLDVSTSSAGDNFAMARRTTSGGTVAAAYTFTNDWDGLSAFEVLAGSGGTQSISSVSLSNSSFAGGSASGTVVGTISEVMSPTSPAFSGTLSLSGTGSSNFQIVGSNLETSGVVATGTYSNLNIVATESGAVGSPFTQAETITGTGPLTLTFLPQVACSAPAGTLVMAFQASGGDGNTITYSLTGDTTDFAISGTNVVVGSSGIAPANCGMPNAVAVTATQP